MNLHLTNEQLLDLFEDAPQPALAAHLRDCAPCRSEFNALRESLTSFRTAATGIAKMYSPAEAPTHLIQSSSTHPGFFNLRFLTPRTAWATGLVTAIALCTASLSVMHRTTQSQAPISEQMVSRIATPSDTPAAQTSVSDADTALLDGIDRDLSTSVPPSLQPLDVTAASETTSTSSHN